MQFFPHTSNDDTAYASIRLNKDEIKALRKFMHTPDYHKNIGFPNGVRLYYRSMGWYRLDTTNNTVACKKIMSALAIFKKFQRQYQAATASDVKRALIAQHPNLQTVAYVDEPSMIGKFHVVNRQDKIPHIQPLESRLPADPKKLELLAATFAKQRKAHA